MLHVSPMMILTSHQSMQPLAGELGTLYRKPNTLGIQHTADHFNTFKMRQKYRDFRCIGVAGLPHFMNMASQDRWVQRSPNSFGIALKVRYAERLLVIAAVPTGTTLPHCWDHGSQEPFIRRQQQAIIQWNSDASIRDRMKISPSRPLSLQSICLPGIRRLCHSTFPGVHPEERSFTVPDDIIYLQPHGTGSNLRGDTYAGINARPDNMGSGLFRFILLTRKTQGSRRFWNIPNHTNWGINAVTGGR